MDLRIVTLDHSNALKPVARRQTREERQRQKDRRTAKLWGCVSGICIGLVIGIIIGNSAAGLAVGAVTSSPEPQQMVSKLEIPASATVSLLDVVKIAQSEQEAYACINTEKTHAWGVPLTDEEMTAVLETCEAGHIDVPTGLGLIKVESDFRADALNPESGCYGYCQLNPQYFPSDLSPADNIRAGLEYLTYQLERYDGDLGAALTAYNAGYDTGSRTYADTVIAAAAEFEKGVK